MTESFTVPISLVAHTVFCARRAWLEAQGETVDSDAIATGTAYHKRVDDPTESRPGVERAMLVHSATHGINGKCDVVIAHDPGRVSVIEYKSTPVRRKAEITESHRIQVLTQVLCLEEMGYEVSEASVHFVNHNKRVSIALDANSRNECLKWIEDTKSIILSDRAPDPLVDDKRCNGCSHAVVCLPDEHKRQSSQKPRTISVSNPHGTIVHMVTPGARASIAQGRLTVTHKGDELASIPIEQVFGIVAFGNTDISSALMRELFWRGLSIVWCSYRGHVLGWSVGAKSPNGLARMKQQALSLEGCLPIAQRMIKSKIANHATLIRRNGQSPESVQSLRTLAKQTIQMQSLPELLALEGRAAQVYFSAFPTMFKHKDADQFLQHWPGRRGRGATDPLNAALNFVYGLLLADCIRALAACGLDPHGGFLHSPNRNKPALALDLMEEFRGPIADSIVLTLINTGGLRSNMFTNALGDARLKPNGIKALTTAYEQRISSTIKHPIFEYTVTWRRTIEVQARILLGVIDGTRDHYVGMTTR